MNRRAQGDFSGRGLPAGSSGFPPCLFSKEVTMNLSPIAAALLWSCAAGAGAAPVIDGYPNRPVRIVVQYQAGGATDALARILTEALSKRLHQPLVVDNRSGATGIIGTDHVAKSAADGYTLLLTTPAAISTNLVLYKKLPYDPRTDLRMISDVVRPSLVLAVHPSVPARDFRTLIEAIRRSPGKYAMGSWGAGTLPHQIQVYMDKTYGLQTLHVAYKGESPMSADLISGVVQITLGSAATLKPFINTGKLRALAVVGDHRAQGLPQVPTFSEQGYKEAVYSNTGAISLMAPARTPDFIVQRVAHEVAAVMREPSVRERAESLGLEPVGNTPAEATAAYASFLPVALDLARSTGVSLD